MRRANGELALASGRAHQQQVGDVGAGDQQHEAHRAHHHQQRRTHIADNGVAQRLNRKSVLRAKRIRVAAAELIGCELHLRVGLGQRHAGLEPPGGHEIVALVGAVGIELKGQPHVGFGIRDEGLSEHADDGVGLIAQREGGSDDVWDCRQICAATDRSSAPRPCRHWASLPAA